jgi:hypothetical protein
VTTQIPITHLPDFCAIADPHATYPVPATQGLPYMVATSGSGSYYYTTLCKAYVVDIKMATYSNTDPVQGVPQNPTGALSIGAGAYDLPSSQEFGGFRPIVQEDCNRLKVWARFYLKRHNEDHFTKLDEFHTTTSWDPSTLFCKIDGAKSIAAHVSEVGWDTYRVAVYVILRTSAQEVAVTLQSLPPT